MSEYVVTDVQNLDLVSEARLTNNAFSLPQVYHHTAVLLMAIHSFVNKLAICGSAQLCVLLVTILILRHNILLNSLHNLLTSAFIIVVITIRFLHDHGADGV